MKKYQKILLCIAIPIVILLTAVLLSTLLPSQGVWDIAECVSRNDDFYIWTSDRQHHTHYINNEAQSAAEKVLDDLKLSQRSIGNYTFFDQENMIVLEVSDHRVQYFLFNEDFTVVWAADNSWINERPQDPQGESHTESMGRISDEYNKWGNTACAAYRVKNPRAVREYFESVCRQDDKYNQ